MNLVMNNFNKDNIFLLDPIKNFVIDNAYFYKLIYSTDILSLNNILFIIKLTNITLYKSGNKYKLVFDNNTDNRREIERLYKVENDILSRTKLSGVPVMDLFDNLKSNSLKLYTKHVLPERLNEIYVNIKISGIWKTNKNYGITYKFSL